MNILGLTITRTKHFDALVKKALPQLNSVESARGWWPIIRESYAGAWQRNEEITIDNVTTHATVFACVTLTANDIAKMHMRLVQQDADGIWNEVEVPAFSPVLRKPNHFQNRLQFYEQWIISKQLNGNTYVLKVRDQRRVVVKLYVLDPTRVRPLVAPDGSVYYDLKRDDISLQPQEAVIVPASEIIHDRHNCLFHPLVGQSPIYACGLAAVEGLNIQNSSTRLFQNGATPGGVLTAPGPISEATAIRIKERWETEYSGENAGKVAVLGDGLKFERMAMSAVDAQLIDQLRWTGENICTAFHVPPYMVGIGPPPNYNNIEALNQQYYSQCLQVLIESIELCLDEGLGVTEGEIAAKRYGTEFDIDDLLRMDSATMMQTLQNGKDYFTPNEGRKKLGLKPVPGGNAVYRQQQDFSIEALNRRDQAAAAPTTDSDVATAPVVAGQTPEVEDEDEARDFEARLLTKAAEMARAYAA